MIRWKSAILPTFSALLYSSQPIASFISIAVLSATGTELTTYNMFMTLALVSTMRVSVSWNIAQPMNSLADFWAALRRIQDFLEVQDLRRVPANNVLRMAFQLDTESNTDREEQANTKKPSLLKSILSSAENVAEDVPCQEITTAGNQDTPETLSLNSAVCYWQEGESMAVLKSVSLTISDGELVLVTGPVGCGKSSLLLAILQELPLFQGTISCSGKIMHVPQQSWIFSGTVQENILFGQAMDPLRYNMVLDACDLVRDIQNFPDGDLTMIGERGVLLSGGQRARVDLARAVYADADVYLLDDPLSAVDAKVAKHIFLKCICGLLAHKTRIVVTHREEFLRNAKHIVIMKEGSVISEGSYTGLLKAGVAFQQMCDKDVNQEESPATHDSHSIQNNIREEGMTGLEIEEEDRMTGSVSWSLYWNYFRAGLSSFSLIILAVFFVFVQGKSDRVRLDRFNIQTVYI